MSRRAFGAVCLLCVAVLCAVAVTTKVYNVKSFGCLINGEWEGAPAVVSRRESALAGDINAQRFSGVWYVAGVCTVPSAAHRKTGLQWLQRTAQNASSTLNDIRSFYHYARLYQKEAPSFLPLAARLVMRVADPENKFRLDRAMIECERGEREWQQCRELMQAESEGGGYNGKFYYAEILAHGLGGETDRDKAAALIKQLFATVGTGLPGAAEMEALSAHKKNLLD